MPRYLAILAVLAAPAATLAQASTLSLRLYGHGTGDIDRVKIPIDAPARPADAGAGDFTVEFWMKALPGENAAGSCVSGNDGWINGHIIVDRDVFGAGDFGDFGISLFEDGLAFGVGDSAGGNGLCGAVAVDDGAWHHVAVTRGAGGAMRLWVDGAPDGPAVTGPAGDVSYRDGRATSYPNDPFLVLGAEKHDAGPAYPSFSGWIDELRISTVVRYTAPFARPTAPFVADAQTAALYHFDEGPAGPCTGAVLDESGAAGGPSDGACSYGGAGTAGPVYSTDAAPLASLCGNGTLDPGEACDDGNPTDGDGCDSNCTVTACGNGIPTAGEACDDGNPTAGDGCEPDCTLTPPLLLSGRSLLVRDRGGDPAKRRLVVQTRDLALPAPVPGSASDPRLGGAVLRLGRGAAEVAAISLPAAGWRGLGDPAGSAGYAYADSKRLLGPCKAVKLQPGRQLKATCLGAGVAFTLDEPSQGALAVDFRPGAAGPRSCLVFGGTVVKDTPAAPGVTGQFKAKLAPPPGSCPLP
jgi:cysteine-rich repeat protein